VSNVARDRAAIDFGTALPGTPTNIAWVARLDREARELRALDRFVVDLSLVTLRGRARVNDSTSPAGLGVGGRSIGHAVAHHPERSRRRMSSHGLVLPIFSGALSGAAGLEAHPRRWDRTSWTATACRCVSTSDWVTAPDARVRPWPRRPRLTSPGTRPVQLHATARRSDGAY